ncbi:hypothetical protein L345_01480, partial [Ophiophagus hannah]
MGLQLRLLYGEGSKPVTTGPLTPITNICFKLLLRNYGSLLSGTDCPHPTILVSKTDSPELIVEPCQGGDGLLFCAPSLPDTQIPPLPPACSGCKASNCWERRELWQKERKSPQEEEEEEKEGTCTDLGAPEEREERRGEEKRGRREEEG